ncbi:MAG: polysulfide reductase NrfD, partial [Anaerolineales bacterium]
MTNIESKSITKKFTPFWAWIVVLGLLVLVGLLAALRVFQKGLVLTNLTDLVPWGLWITIDLSSIALSAGAFSLCAVVYIVGLKKYYPLARTATFIGFVGYSMAMMCLLMDIGRPDRFWHGFVFWNPHSVLWEVTMCVGLYFSVLSLEMLPILSRWEWFNERWPKLSEKLANLHHFAPVLAIAGLIFSMLHQSSLGATYGVLQARPIWYSPSLSFLFMFSAIVGGVSLTLLVSILAARLSRKANVDNAIIDKVAVFIGWALVAYIYVRFWYIFSMTYTYEPGQTEGLQLMLSGPLALNFWFGEFLLGALIPCIILLKASWRKNYFLLATALTFVVIGVVSYRWDVNLSGQLIVMAQNPQGVNIFFTEYTPAFIEVMVGGGVVAYGLLAISLGVQYL